MTMIIWEVPAAVKGDEMADTSEPIRGRGHARRERARATRKRVIEAAYRLFSNYGYAVPMEAIAREASVAVQTVYFTFRTKADLFKDVIAFASAGEDDATPVMERAWVKEVEAAVTGRRAVALIVEHGVDIFRRLAPLAPAVQSAISLEPDLGRYWQAHVDGRRRAMRHFIEVLAEKALLPRGVSVNHAADVLFVLQSPETLAGFTGACGWSVEEYKAWLYRTFCEQLLVRLPEERTEAQEIDPLADLSYADIVVSMV
jgi:AcrR family transcriptional regulator